MKELLTPTTLAGLPIVKAKDRPPYINMLIYGESGVGKTYLAGTADDVPSLRKVLFIDMEGGTLTLLQSNPNVDVMRVQSWLEMQDVYNSLFAGGHGYSTVVIDSLTEAQKFNMYHILKNLVEDKEDRDPDIAGMREWGKNIEQIRRFVRGFRDLPCNTIFTALMREDKNQKTGAQTRKPMLSGKLASEVAAFLDIVVFLYKKEIDGEQRRLLLTAATDDTVAKDRTGKLPGPVLENPTMKQIYQFINQEEPAA